MFYLTNKWKLAKSVLVIKKYIVYTHYRHMDYSEATQNFQWNKYIEPTIQNINNLINNFSVTKFQCLMLSFFFLAIVSFF